VATLLIMSVLIATVLIPISAAKDPSQRRGYRRTIVGLFVFNTIYVVCLLYLYRRLL
jgi:hypothetical protein